MEMVPCHIDTHKVACIRVQAICIGPPAACRADLALILQKSFGKEFADKFGYRRDADAEFTAEVRDAVIRVGYAESQDFPLDSGIFTLGVIPVSSRES